MASIEELKDLGIETVDVSSSKKKGKDRSLPGNVAEFIAPTTLSTFETIKEGERPTLRQLGGTALEVGSLVVPGGAILRGLGMASKAGRALVGAGKAAQTANKARTLTDTIKVGSTIGGASSAGRALGDEDASLSEILGETAIGATIGAGLPATIPLAKALKNVSGRLAAETQGALTGTSAETIEQAFLAGKKGGRELDQFTQALRGQLTPEQLVNNVRESIQTVSTARGTLFKNTLAELGDTRVATDIAKKSFKEQLEGANIKIGKKGNLDFSGSKLRTVPNAQTKLQQAWNEVNSMPKTDSIFNIDTTRQAVKAITSIAGDEPSANLANKLIDDASRSVRKAGEQVEGYGKMLDNFSSSSDFLDELQRGLSAGDRQTIDQTYRRIATSLRTNNEQRKALVQELDKITNGSLLSEISGQQLSEALPRGLFRQIAAGLAGAGIATGGISASLLPTLLFASPRVTGEFVRALGIGSRKADAVIDTIAKARDVLLKAGIISGIETAEEVLPKQPERSL